jgi:hypothetical protein
VWDLGEDVEGSLEKERKPLSTWGFLGVKKCGDLWRLLSYTFMHVF